MTLPLDISVTCPVVIGRERYLHALATTLDAAASGSGAVVSISGEAGLGKSRLVAEVRRQAESRDPAMRVLQGNCFEPDVSLPYAPILDMLRACLSSHQRSDIVACIGPDGPDLVRLVPELRSALPDVEPAPVLDPEQEKRRLFSALLSVFERVAASRPLVLVFEDVHWSDDTSLEFLRQLARSAAAHPILTVLTYRSDEVQPSLRRLLAALTREKHYADWPLSRLSEGEATSMVAAIFGHPDALAAQTVRAIYPPADGNPLFIEELLKAMVSHGRVDDHGVVRALGDVEVPRSLQASVASRMERLSAEDRRIIELASAVGRRFDFALLQHLSGLDEDELLAVVKRLIAEQLVVEESADRFAFRHALTQQAVYTGLLAREQRSLHASIAAAIERMHGDEIERHVSDLAHHYFEAEAWDEAYYYCRRAAEQAQTMHAVREAAMQYARAIGAAERLGVPAPASLLRARGQAMETLGEFERARTDYEAAHASASTAGDRPGEWRALIDLGYLWAGRDYERAGALFERASALAAEIGAPLLIARSRNMVGNWLVNIDRPEEALAYHEYALDIFEANGDARGIAETLDLLAMASALGGSLSRAATYGRQAVAMYREQGDRKALANLEAVVAFFASSLQSPTLAPGLSEEESRACFEDSFAICREIGFTSGESFAKGSFAGRLAALGEWRLARLYGQEALALAQEAGHVQWETYARLVLAECDRLSGNLDDALTGILVCCECARRTNSLHWRRGSAGSRALTLIQRGELEEAERIIDEALPRDLPPTSMSKRSLWYARAHLALARGRPADALATLGTLERTQVDAEPGRYDLLPGIGLLVGEALLQQGDAAAAVGALRLSLEGSRRFLLRPMQLDLQIALGRALAAAGQRDEAARAFGDAQPLIEGLAAELDEPDAGRFREYAAARLPASVRSSRTGEKERFGGLTPREREVAGLVARGLSNREIADALVLGERTVETHVGHILAKLGFGSRAQIAAWAVEAGLVSR